MRVYNKNRSSDERKEMVIAKFLDTHFYCDAKNFERVTDVNRQVQGTDVIFTMGGRQYNCDEKAATSWINKALNTFALELSCYNRGGNLMTGWFLDSSKINDSFLFVWVDKATTDYLNSVDEIKDIEIALVRKRDIMNYLTDKGWSVEKLMVKSQRLRSNPDEPKGDLKINGCRFVESPKLPEDPINVLIPRKELIRMSDINRRWRF